MLRSGSRRRAVVGSIHAWWVLFLCWKRETHGTHTRGPSSVLGWGTPTLPPIRVGLESAEDCSVGGMSLVGVEAQCAEGFEAPSAGSGVACWRLLHA